jgi:glycosyltransferase involved in cell wall biosynthesis
MTDRWPERLCLVVPAFNEADNLAEVVPEALEALDAAGLDATVVVVDDGSTDATPQVIEKLCVSDPRIRGLRLRRNRGKSVALNAGLAHADGDVIVLMDADGQDDPAAIPALVEALRQGNDLVTGRRADRKDGLVKRRTSKLYNVVTSRVTGVPGRDFNSGLKAMRREVTVELDLHGELHRYIPVLAHWAGFRVTEVDVAHRPRRYGESKFGGNRFWRGFYDLLTVNFLVRYNARPFHLFGTIGAALGLTGLALLAWMTVVKLSGEPIGNRPAFLAGVFLVIVAVQILSIGLTAELIVHARHARHDAHVVEIVGDGRSQDA